MKARRFFAFVAGAAMLFGVGCTPDNGGNNGGDEALAEITVTPASFATDLEGGEQVIAVTSNATWTVSCDQADVTIEPLTGNGNGSVTITVPAASAREFKVVFDAQKQTLIPALGTSTTTTAKAELVVSQNATGTDQNNFLYYEKCGENVEKDGNYWPYVDKFTGWTPEGDAAANVVYSGNNASVRASGKAYQPTEDAVGVSGQPYVFLNKVPAQAYFVIENLAITGGSNYIFHFNVQCQNGYSDSPTFATVDNALVHLELGYDGQTWNAVDCTFVENGGNGWYAASAEFKVKADATVLYARFTYEAPASNGGGRFDDFKLVAGGSGAELAPEAPVVSEGTIADITAAGSYNIENAWVLATYAQGFLMTDSSNAIILVYQGSAEGVVVPEVGQVVNVSGNVTTYGGLLQFGKDAVVEQVAGQTKTVTYGTPQTLTYNDITAYVNAPSIFLAEMTGKLVVKDSGKGYNNYNIELEGGTSVKGSISYPATELASAMDALNDKYVVARGFMIGKPNSNAYYANMMALEVVETDAPVNPDPDPTPDPNPDPVPEGGDAYEITTASLVAGVPNITTNNYGSQNVTDYSTFLTWGNYAACKVCLPQAGNYATADCLQMQGNTDAAKQGRIGNVTATPKRITKVIVESWNEKYTPNFNLALGTEQVVGTTVPSDMIPASSMTTTSEVVGALTKYVSTYEVTSGDYTHFAIYKNTTGAFYFSKIRVEYAE